MPSIVPEIRRAFRSLLAARGFSLLVISVLGAGIACVLFMLAIINGLLLKPLPFADSEYLLAAGYRQTAHPGDLRAVAGPDVVAWQALLGDDAGVAGIAQGTVTVSDAAGARRYAGAYATASLLPLLRVHPAIGRGFSEADDRPGAALTAIISDDVWHSAYGGAGDIVGKATRVNGEIATIIGVMAPGFSFPQREQIWIPARIDRNESRRDSLDFSAMVRVRDSSGPTLVRTRLEAWLSEARAAEPEYFRDIAPDVEAFDHFLVNAQSRALIGLMLAAVILVLMVAIANAANLILARALDRRQELAVRVALGAGRRRLLASMVTESLLLALAAICVALPLAMAGVQWLITRFAETANAGPPTWMRFDIDARMVGFAVLVAIATGLLAGFVPALLATKASIASNLREGSRTSTSAAFARVSRILVVGEIALCCTLLVTAGVLIGGIRAIADFDLGVDQSRMLTARVALPATRLPGAADQVRFMTQLVDELRKAPDVVDASATTALPGWNGDERPLLPDGVAPGGEATPHVRLGAVDRHFAAAFGARIRQGRFLDERDEADGPLAAVVDETFAARYGSDIVGKSFVLEPGTAAARSFTVVGVVGRLQLDGIDNPIIPSVLVPFARMPDRYVSVGIRARQDPAAFAPRLAQVVQSLDRDTPAYFVRTYDEVLAEGSFGDHLLGTLFTGFGLIALLLAGVGLYGVIAYSVGRRTREIGIRRAFGAANARLLRSVMGGNVVLIATGLALGLGLGVPFSDMLAGNLVGPIAEAMRSQHLVFVLVPALLAAVASAAALVPARRALRVDPMQVLRES